MTNEEIYESFKSKYPDLDVDDYRPISNLFTENRQGITVFLKNGDILVYYPMTELKNCKCGGKASVYKYADSINRYAILCDKYYCNRKFIHVFHTIDEAVDYWNNGGNEIMD